LLENWVGELEAEKNVDWRQFNERAVKIDRCIRRVHLKLPVYEIISEPFVGVRAEGLSPA
jgi:hypothetical protein